MTRAFLVTAMAISLWPVGAILLLGQSENRGAPVQQAPAFRGETRPSAARPELETIASRVHDLNEDLGDDAFYIGGIAAGLAYRASEIEEELQRWFSAWGGEASGEEKRVARKMIVLARAMGDLAESTTQKNLRTYNRALKGFNAAIE